jgi:parallel beta-helix repeat protein
MNERLARIVILGLLLIFFSAMCNVSAAETSGTIHINVFGVVVPSSAPIQRNGSLYTFTADVSEAIQIEANDIVVDGAGRTVQGTGTGTGIIVGNPPDLPIVYNVTLRNMRITSFQGGILLRYCLNCSILGVNITLITSEGISVYQSSNGKVAGNQVSAQTASIRLDQAHNNNISRNNATDSYDGVEIWSSQNNSIVENNITGNSWGIRLSDSSNNKIFHNNFFNNTHQVYLDNEGKDIWDDGFPSGGNYWSDYREKYPNATETDNSGLWNTPYVLDINNRDNYPIIPEFSTLPIMPVFLAATLLAAATVWSQKRKSTRAQQFSQLKK